MESKEPEFEEPKQPEAETTPPTEETPPPPISSSSGVEDVPKLVESTTEPSITSTAKPTEGTGLYMYMYNVYYVATVCNSAITRTCMCNVVSYMSLC